jgi:hypothetical protein
MTQFSTHPYFGNSAEKFYGDETLSTPIKLLSSLTSLIRCHINTFNARKTLMKLHSDWPKEANPATQPPQSPYLHLLFSTKVHTPQRLTSVHQPDVRSSSVSLPPRS